MSHSFIFSRVVNSMRCFGAVGRFDDGDRRLRIAMAQEKALGFDDLLRAAAALRVVERDDEIGIGHGIEPAGDGRPRRQQVGQRNGAEVVGQRRTDQRGAGVQRRSARG
jgi:hypothetical protein